MVSPSERARAGAIQAQYGPIWAHIWPNTARVGPYHPGLNPGLPSVMFELKFNTKQCAHIVLIPFSAIALRECRSKTIIARLRTMMSRSKKDDVMDFQKKTV